MRSTLHRLRAFLGDCHVEQRIGDDYDVLVTTGTGERHYGSALGGSCAFAYATEDVERFLDGLDDGPGDYTDMCETLHTIETRELALVLAYDGLRLTHAGACNPVLTDDEFVAARDAEEEP